MYGIAIIAASFTLPVQPLEIPRDVHQLDCREFVLPLEVQPEEKEQMERVRLYESKDGGQTWTHVKDAKPTDDRFRYKATQDGLFYFAVQVEYKDGTCAPAELTRLLVQQKVYVNTEHRTLKPRKSYEDLQREVEELQKTVQRLKKKVAELESKP